MMLKILHNNSCSKSRAVLEYLDDHGIPFEVIDIVDKPLSVLEIKTLIRKLQLPVDELIRKNEKVYLDRFSNTNYSEDEWIKLLTNHPELIQRPIIIKDSVAMIARPIEKVKLFI